uniref:C2H2-type domain-containing protein n=1 Tax=Marseillevirus LCMAC101 TaxID=2506602 RepID=A0A481YSL4_9VIRU|nr:MAG: hypothetical protein LCMAC101_03400 [Marseillevirus LCMAC101]
MLRHQRDVCDPSKNLVECQFCEKKFNRTSNLKRHEVTCLHKKQKEYDSDVKTARKKYKKSLRKIQDRLIFLEEENIKLKETVSEQKGIIEGMKEAPDKKTIYNTAIHPKLVNLPINNIRALTDEFVIEQVNNGILTYEKASRGYPGMLEVICDLITHENDDGIVERNYVCTDVSRNSFHRLLESKKWKSDKGGRYLNNMLDTFRDVMEDHKNKVYDIYKKTSHESFEWEQVNWERKNISKLYSGVVCKEGTGDREELVNILRKEISKRASV